VGVGLNILAIDTSGPSAGAAVLRDGEILSEIFLNNGLTHSQTIMPATCGQSFWMRNFRMSEKM